MAERGLTATVDADPTASGSGKTPRTERGRRTRRALLDAAALEFGEKGFHDSSIVSITARAGVALGTFYTYFDSKDGLFQALVSDISNQVRASVLTQLADPRGDTMSRERQAFVTFLAFAREHKELYRVIDEAEFVAPAEWRAHYENAAQRILGRLRDGETRGELAGPIDEAHAWAIMGMNVFLGLRYGVQQRDRPIDEIADIANALIRQGLAR